MVPEYGAEETYKSADPVSRSKFKVWLPTRTFKRYSMSPLIDVASTLVNGPSFARLSKFRTAARMPAGGSTPYFKYALSISCCADHGTCLRTAVSSRVNVCFDANSSRIVEGVGLHLAMVHSRVKLMNERSDAMVASWLYEELKGGKKRIKHLEIPRVQKRLEEA